MYGRRNAACRGKSVRKGRHAIQGGEFLKQTVTTVVPARSSVAGQYTQPVTEAVRLVQGSYRIDRAPGDIAGLCARRVPIGTEKRPCGAIRTGIKKKHKRELADDDRDRVSVAMKCCT